MARYPAILWNIVLDTAPYMLLGMLLSGVVNEVLNRRRDLSRFAARRSFRSLTVFNLFGSVLPICSCGVVPMAVGLRQGHRIPAGNVFAFLFSAPATSLTALILASAALGWRFTLFYLAGALLCGYAVGAVFYFLESRDMLPGVKGRALPAAGDAPSGPGRFWGRAVRWGLGVYGSRIAFDQIAGLCLCALIVTVLSVSDLSWWLNNRPYPVAALVMVAVALPLYVCSLPAILMAGAFVAGGLRPELAWVFLMAGPVTNLGDMNVLRRQIGSRATWIYAVLVVTLVISWGPALRAGLDPSSVIARADAYFVDRAVPQDLCVVPAEQGSARNSPGYWEILKYFTAPIYLLLILMGAVTAAVEFAANPCHHCRHYQHDLSIQIGSCPRPCWKKTIWPLLGRISRRRDAPGSGSTGLSDQMSPMATSFEENRFRRRLLLAVLTGAVVAYLHVTVNFEAGPSPLRPTPGYLKTIQGYTAEFSFAPQDEIEILFAGGPAHGGQKVTSVLVYNAVTGAEVLRRESLSIPMSVTPCRSFRDDGCGFSGRISLSAAKLPPGTYRAEIRTDADEVSEPVYFNIRRPYDRAASPPIAVMYPSFTWQAYNAAGGLSFYGRGLEPELSVVSRRRPLPADGIHSPALAVLFPRFLHQGGYSFLTLDNLDLHRQPQLLDGVRLLIVTIHDEYWTEEMRRGVEAFLDQGGRLLVAAGNTCWWKVRLEGSNIVVNKHNRDTEPDPGLRTGHWRNEIIGDPEEKTFGLSWLGGGYPVQRQFPQPGDVPAEFKLAPDLFEASAGMRVMNPAHPVFAGTGLRLGDVFGADLPIMDVEVDGPADPEGQPPRLRSLSPGPPKPGAAGPVPGLESHRPFNAPAGGHDRIHLPWPGTGPEPGQYRLAPRPAKRRSDHQTHPEERGGLPARSPAPIPVSQ